MAKNEKELNPLLLILIIFLLIFLFKSDVFQSDTRAEAATNCPIYECGPFMNVPEGCVRARGINPNTGCPYPCNLNCSGDGSQSGGRSGSDPCPSGQSGSRGNQDDSDLRSGMGEFGEFEEFEEF